MDEVLEFVSPDIPKWVVLTDHKSILHRKESMQSTTWLPTGKQRSEQLHEEKNMLMIESWDVDA